MLKDFRGRTIIAAVFIVAISSLIIFAYSDWFQYVVAIATALFTTVAIWEYEQFAKAKGGNMILPVLIAFGFFEVFSFFIGARDPTWAALPIAVFFIALLTLFALYFRENEGALVNLSASSFGLLYIAIPMGMILGILYGEGQDGRWWVAYLLLVTKSSDVGAYFGGSLWGRRKLAPNISPGKTVEGALLGFACAVILSLGLYFISRMMDIFCFDLGIGESIFLGAILGITGQFSDLAESLLKRDANKKDSNILPGVGGVLDMIDSLLFTAPIVYLYLHFFINHDHCH